MKESFLILIFEFMGTAFLTLLYSSYAGLGDTVGLFIGFFVLLLFSMRISGSHYNPAVTLVFIFRGN